MTDKKAKEKNTARRFIILLCGLFILLGVVFFTAGIVNIVKCANDPADKIDYSKEYSKVTAIVKSVRTEKHTEVEDGKWITSESMTIRIYYEADGQPHEGVLNEYREGTEEGDRIDVYYLNSDPETVRLNLPGSDKTSQIFSCVFWIAFGGFWLVISVVCTVIGLRETAGRK